MIDADGKLVVCKGCGHGRWVYVLRPPDGYACHIHEEADLASGSGDAVSRHLLTTEDRRKGALVTNALYPGRRHKLTKMERRRGGLATAAKRRAKRLEAIYLGGPEKTFAEATKMEAKGRALAEKLMEGTNPDASTFSITQTTGDLIAERERQGLCINCGGPLKGGRVGAGDGSGQKFICLPCHYAREPIDPFTLSALKRFRLGPVSPFQLTRSQRAHCPIMRDAGYIELDAGGWWKLTEKGRLAIEVEGAVGNG